MCTKEARVLTDDVHDVRGNDGLVVLATLLLAQSEQFLVEMSFNDEKTHGVRERTLMTVTRKRFSSSSTMAPEIDPMAQQS